MRFTIHKIKIIRNFLIKYQTLFPTLNASRFLNDILYLPNVRLTIDPDLEMAGARDLRSEDTQSTHLVVLT